jgi:hypothetical protein
MLADLLSNVFALIAAKRYPVIRKALWVVAAIGLILAIYGGLTS